MNETSLPPVTPSSGELSALRAIVEGTAHGIGDEFFRALVRHLADALGVEHSLIAEFATPIRVRTLAFWQRDQLVPNVEYDLAGTPCEDVARGNLCHHPIGVAKKFPLDLPLAEMGIESSLGVPLISPGRQILGHLCVFDPKPM